MKKGKFSVCSAGQKRKCCGEIGAGGWNDQCLGPRGRGLESLIQRRGREKSEGP